LSDLRRSPRRSGDPLPTHRRAAQAQRNPLLPFRWPAEGRKSKNGGSLPEGDAVSMYSESRSGDTSEDHRSGPLRLRRRYELSSGERRRACFVFCRRFLPRSRLPESARILPLDLCVMGSPRLSDKLRSDTAPVSASCACFQATGFLLRPANSRDRKDPAFAEARFCRQQIIFRHD
jgi:hypothetical protein